MEQLIKCIVQQEGQIHDITIYYSIAIAYLEQAKWPDAYKIITLLENEELDENESKAWAYLSVLCELEDLEGIASLSAAL